MKKALQPSCLAGFTIIELMVAASIFSTATITFVSVLNYTGYAIFDITQQTDFNQSASNTALRIIQRTRSSHAFEISSQGNRLSLSFDDDYKVDSNGDGDCYNDTDHQEFFIMSQLPAQMAKSKDSSAT